MFFFSFCIFSCYLIWEIRNKYESIQRYFFWHKRLANQIAEKKKNESCWGFIHLVTNTVYLVGDLYTVYWRILLTNHAMLNVWTIKICICKSHNFRNMSNFNFRISEGREINIRKQFVLLNKLHHMAILLHISYQVLWPIYVFKV